jgi:hypothetical protein
MRTDFRLLRIVRKWLDGPSTMQVGDVAAVRAVDEYDDGSRKAYTALVNSSNPTVVQVLPCLRPFSMILVLVR